MVFIAVQTAHCYCILCTLSCSLKNKLGTRKHFNVFLINPYAYGSFVAPLYSSIFNYSILHIISLHVCETSWEFDKLVSKRMGDDVIVLFVCFYYTHNRMLEYVVQFLLFNFFYFLFCSRHSGWTLHAKITHQHNLNRPFHSLPESIFNCNLRRLFSVAVASSRIHSYVNIDIPLLLEVPLPSSKSWTETYDPVLIKQSLLVIKPPRWVLSLVHFEPLFSCLLSDEWRVIGFMISL